MSSQWKVYLLDPEKVAKLKEKERRIYALKDKEIEDVKIYGPVLRGEDTNARAKSAFYTDLKEKPWFKDSPFANIPYRYMIPFILVKNVNDKRFTKEEPDIEGLMELIKAHAEEMKEEGPANE